MATDKISIDGYIKDSDTNKKVITFVNSLYTKFAIFKNRYIGDNQLIKVEYPGDNLCYKLKIEITHFPPGGKHKDDYFKVIFGYYNKKNKCSYIPWHLSIYAKNRIDSRTTFVHVTRENDSPGASYQNYQRLLKNKNIIDTINYNINSHYGRDVNTQTYLTDKSIEDLIDSLYNNNVYKRLLYNNLTNNTIIRNNLDDDDINILDKYEYFLRQGIIHILLEFNKLFESNSKIKLLNDNLIDKSDIIGIFNENRKNYKFIEELNDTKYFKDTLTYKNINDLIYNINRNRCSLKTNTYYEIIKKNYECYLEESLDKNFDDILKDKNILLLTEKKKQDIINKEIITNLKLINDLKVNLEQAKNKRQYYIDNNKNNINNFSLWTINNEIISLDNKIKLDKEILDEFISFIKKYTKLNTNNLSSEDIKNVKINNNNFLIINKDLKNKLKKNLNNNNKYYFEYNIEDSKFIFTSNNLEEYDSYFKKLLNELEDFNSKSIDKKESSSLKSISNNQSSLSTSNSIETESEFNFIKENKTKNFSKKFNDLIIYIKKYIKKYNKNYKKIGKLELLNNIEDKIENYEKLETTDSNDNDQIIANIILLLLFDKYRLLIRYFDKVNKNEDKLKKLVNLLDACLKDEENKLFLTQYNLIDENYNLNKISKIIEKTIKIKHTIKLKNINNHSNLSDSKKIQLENIIKTNNTIIKFVNNILFNDIKETESDLNKKINYFSTKNDKKNKDLISLYIKNFVESSDFEIKKSEKEELFNNIIKLINILIENKYMINIKEIKTELKIKKDKHLELKISSKEIKNKYLKFKKELKEEIEFNKKYYNEIINIYKIFKNNSIREFI